MSEFHGFPEKRFPYGQEKLSKGSRRKPIMYVETENGCWNCVSHTTNKGYSVIRHNHRLYGGHQLAYILAKGDIPKGLVVRHKCDNRLCINPDHLELGTIADNNRDARERSGVVPPPTRFGAENASTILTEEQVLEIKKELQNSYRGLIPTLAKKYGVTNSTIKNIKYGLSWAWLEANSNE